MRIISGNLKGRKIFLPEDKHTRPLKDMVKESIFNLIEHSNKFNLKINNSIVLDLFSGSGSFGLECLSRGAKKIIFVENYFKTLKTLKKNIQKLEVQDKIEVIEKDCFEYLDEQFKFKEKFKIIFLDPPYKEKNINLLIEMIKDKKILEDKGAIIIHRHKSDDTEISYKLRVLDKRKYGISKIIIGV